MATVKVTIECATLEEAQKILSQVGNPIHVVIPEKGSVVQPGNGATQPRSANFQPAPTAVSQPQTQTGPSATIASPTNQHTVQSVVPLMQDYAKQYKAAGVKAAFAKHGLPAQLTQLDAAALNTMAQFFANMQPA